MVRARLLVQTEAVGGEYDDSIDGWRIGLRSTESPEPVDPVFASNVILTAGPWCDSVVNSSTDSDASLAPTGVGPVKGQLLRLRGPRIIDRVVRTSNISLAQRRDGELIVASTKEPEAGWDLTPTDDAREELLDRASELILRVRELDLEEHSVGLRPAVADHLPVIGPAGRPGLWIATGHFQHGILLAPSTAFWLADAIESGEVPELLTPYGIERLGPPGESMEAAS